MSRTRIVVLVVIVSAVHVGTRLLTAEQWRLYEAIFGAAVVFAMIVGALWLLLMRR